MVEEPYNRLAHGTLKHVHEWTLLQKIYLFGAEGTTRDRGRPRPASAAASSPAKRAKTSVHEEDKQQTGRGEDEEDEENESHHQDERGSPDVEMAENDPPSTSKHSTVIVHLFAHRYLTQEGNKTCPGLSWYATLGYNVATWTSTTGGQIHVLSDCLLCDFTLCCLAHLSQSNV